MEKRLLTHYNDNIGKAIINSQWLKEFIHPAPKQAQITEKLLEYFEYYIKCKKNELTLSSVKKLRVVKHLTQRFQDESRTEFLTKNIDLNFKMRFEAYCLKEGYSPNTIARATKMIKTICTHARINGIATHFQLDNISAKYQKVDKIYLSPEELKKIENAKLDVDHLINARDWLIISCETGQRVSDFMRFSKEQIRIENGKHLIEFTQVKTGKLMTVPLSKKVLAILKKRNGEFPREISDQKYNDYIKEVCKLAGLTQKIKGSKKDPETNRKIIGNFPKWELVSSHIGRRSFATNNYGNIPTSLLISATGHSTEKMFLEYIGKTDTQKAMQLAEYF
ncbi:MAG TPA: phage integrase SAM-like domain-containing protein [Bacteroidia bacterium]|nr:phage integrase SAM-like domain-containing protein [Bacteroidia bacterium]